MSVFSSNRISSIAESGFVPNMNYDICDFGKILYECMVNDAAIFKAIVVSDIREAVAIREGTMIMVEADEATKENKKKISEIISESLRKFIEKVQGILANAKRKIQIICANNGKKFNSDAYKSKMEKKIADGGLNGFEFQPVNILNHDNIVMVKNQMNMYFEKIIHKFIDHNDSTVTDDDLFKGVRYTTIDKISSMKEIYQLIESITDNNNIIHLINDMEKATIGTIKRYINILDKNDKRIEDIESIRKEANEYQKTIIGASSFLINTLLKMIKNSCGILNAAASYSAKNASCILYMEAAVEESNAEIDAVIDNPNPEEDSDDNNIDINININYD